jgi:myo-inositol catabolism protein IolS
LKLRSIGRSGLLASEIGLGTNSLGGHNLYDGLSESKGIETVQQAVDLGVNFFDTADAYGFGRSEELLGQALGDRKNDVLIATKGANQFDAKGNRLGVSNDPAYLRTALEASLKRLGRDYVDLYYIHKPDGKTPPEESFGALLRFKEEGKIRAAGVSNFDLDQLKSASKAGPIDALQSQYHLFDREVENEILPFCVEQGISFIPWGPLAFGILGGKYDSSFTLSENDWRNRVPLFEKERFVEVLTRVERLKTIAKKKGVTVAQLAIRWTLQVPSVGSVIAGAKSPEQVQGNVGADGWELTASEMEAIGAIVG